MMSPDCGASEMTVPPRLMLDFPCTQCAEQYDVRSRPPQNDDLDEGVRLFSPLAAPRRPRDPSCRMMVVDEALLAAQTLVLMTKLVCSLKRG